MSDMQIEANRRNAQKSTGPKTSKGKAVSKMNASKHGILSDQVVVRGLIINESEDEFQAFHRRFWEHLAPVGPVEEMLVDQIVTTQWRLRRVLRAESGEVALSVDGGYWSRANKNPTVTAMNWTVLGDPIHAMEKSVTGLDVIILWLEDVRASVEKEGELTEGAIKSVFVAGKPHSLSRELDELRTWFLINPDGLDQAALRAEHKRRVLVFVDRKLLLMRRRRDECELREDNDELARRSAAALPSMDVLDKIMRYETKLHKQLARAMTQLERLQRMRQGEAVPPPLSVDVAEKD